MNHGYSKARPIFDPNAGKPLPNVVDALFEYNYNVLREKAEVEKSAKQQIRGGAVPSGSAVASSGGGDSKQAETTNNAVSPVSTVNVEGGKGSASTNSTTPTTPHSYPAYQGPYYPNYPQMPSPQSAIYPWPRFPNPPPPPVIKPPSPPKSKQKAESATVSFRHASQTAPKTKQPRTTEDERIAELKADPLVVSFDAQSAVCRNCNKRIKLYGKNHYLKGWQNHREICMKKEHREVLLTPPPPKKRVSKQKQNENARIEALQSDPQVASFDKDNIWCSRCSRKIGTGGYFNLGSWHSHKTSCKHHLPVPAPPLAPPIAPTIPPSSPTAQMNATRSRTSEMTRINEVKQDSQALSYGHDFVVCRSCRQRIKLPGPYYLSPWHRHKTTCSGTGPVKAEPIEHIASLYDTPSDAVSPGGKPAPIRTDKEGRLKLKPENIPPTQLRPHMLLPASNGRQIVNIGFRALTAIAASTISVPWSELKNYSDNSCPLESGTPTTAAVPAIISPPLFVSEQLQGDSNGVKIKQEEQTMSVGWREGFKAPQHVDLTKDVAGPSSATAPAVAANAKEPISHPKDDDVIPSSRAESVSTPTKKRPVDSVKTGHSPDAKRRSVEVRAATVEKRESSKPFPVAATVAQSKPHKTASKGSPSKNKVSKDTKVSEPTSSGLKIRLKIPPRKPMPMEVDR